MWYEYSKVGFLFVYVIYYCFWIAPWENYTFDQVTLVQGVRNLTCQIQKNKDSVYVSIVTKHYWKNDNVIPREQGSHTLRLSES